MRISKEDYEHLPEFFKAVADVAKRSGKVVIKEGDPRED
jgi:hypothetical protein